MGGRGPLGGGTCFPYRTSSLYWGLSPRAPGNLGAVVPRTPKVCKSSVDRRGLPPYPGARGWHGRSGGCGFWSWNWSCWPGTIRPCRRRQRRWRTRNGGSSCPGRSGNWLRSGRCGPGWNCCTRIGSTRPGWIVRLYPLSQEFGQVRQNSFPSGSAQTTRPPNSLSARATRLPPTAVTLSKAISMSVT